MISYYELLKMINEGNIPDKVMLHMIGKDRVYIRENDTDDSFNYYGLENEDLEDNNFRYYLNECFLESNMFEKNIKIIEENKNIEKLDIVKSGTNNYCLRDEKNRLCSMNKHTSIIALKLNELINEINKLKEK